MRTCLYKRICALLLSIALLIMALPVYAFAPNVPQEGQSEPVDGGADTPQAAAQGEAAADYSILEEDVVPPEILFTSGEYHGELPVIYARDRGEYKITSEFFGFSVKDNQTERFEDMTFFEYARPENAGMFEVGYSLYVLNGFCAGGSGEVTITAMDAAGNIARAKAWCEVADFDAPYYMHANPEGGADIVNVLQIQAEQNMPYVLRYADFTGETLVEAHALAALHVVALPAFGALERQQENGEWVEISQSMLPHTISAADLNRLQVRYRAYTPYWNGKDTFVFLPEDTFENRAEDTGAVTAELVVAHKNAPPQIAGIGEEEVIVVPRNAAPFLWPLAISDRESEPDALKVEIAPLYQEAVNETVAVVYDEETGYALSIAPHEDAYGTSVYHLQVTDEEGESTAAQIAVQITKDQLPVRAENDMVTTNGARRVVIDALKNDVAPEQELFIVQTTQPQHGRVTIEENKLVYEYHADAAGTEADYFTYTVSYPGKKHSADERTAAVSINDTQAPKITMYALEYEGEDAWAQFATLRFRAEDDTHIASVALTCMGSDHAQEEIELTERGGEYRATLHKNGKYTLAVRDTAENTRTVYPQVERVDFTPPVVELLTPGVLQNGCIGGGEFLLRVSDTESGLNTLEFADMPTSLIERAVLEETTPGVYRVDVSACDLQGDAVTLRAADHAGNTALWTTGALVFDKQAPEIQVVNSNEAQAYYLPRTFYVSDAKSGVAFVSVDGEQLGVAEEYALMAHWGETKTYTIQAVDNVGNAQEITVAMLGLPLVGQLDETADAAQLKEALRQMEREWQELDGPVLIPGDTPMQMEDLLAALAQEIALLELVANRRPYTHMQQARLVAMREAQNALTDTQRGYLSPKLVDGFEEIWQDMQAYVFTQRAGALPEKTPGAYDAALGTAVEDWMIDFAGQTAAVQSKVDAAVVEKVKALYAALLKLRNIENLHEETGVRVLGLLTRMDEVAAFGEGIGAHGMLIDVVPTEEIPLAPAGKEEKWQALPVIAGYEISVFAKTEMGTLVDIGVQTGQMVMLELPLGNMAEPEIVAVYSEAHEKTRQLMEVDVLGAENKTIVAAQTYALGTVTIKGLLAESLASKDQEPAAQEPAAQEPVESKEEEPAKPANPTATTGEKQPDTEAPAAPEATPALTEMAGNTGGQAFANAPLPEQKSAAGAWEADAPMWPLCVAASILVLILVVRVLVALKHTREH